ncbi:MAG: hypothetical protein KAS94_15325 [Desulfobulbaceae bacterium]|jgi:hypothetical protein|nr:hypothetical protein [Desulfobulbaceae bacterium]
MHIYTICDNPEAVSKEKYTASFPEGNATEAPARSNAATKNRKEKKQIQIRRSNVSLFL